MHCRVLRNRHKKKVMMLIMKDGKKEKMKCGEKSWAGNVATSCSPSLECFLCFSFPMPVCTLSLLQPEEPWHFSPTAARRQIGGRPVRSDALFSRSQPIFHASQQRAGRHVGPVVPYLWHIWSAIHHLVECHHCILAFCCFLLTTPRPYFL